MRSYLSIAILMIIAALTYGCADPSANKQKATVANAQQESNTPKASGTETLAITPENVLGLLSLVLWALILVVTVKYVLFIMRADNRGEGGVLALTALAEKAQGRRSWFVLGAGLFGSAPSRA